MYIVLFLVYIIFIILKIVISPECQYASRSVEHASSLPTAPGCVAPPLPPDAHKLGTPELWYEVRWRRVYGNYYLITLFRGDGESVGEKLMTERDGKDLTPVFGESSKERNLKGYGGSMGGRKKCITKRERVNGEEQYIVYTLISVREKDLPPDFPRGLVRWIP